MKIQIELVTDPDLIKLGYSHEYLVLDDAGYGVRNGIVKSMTGEMLAALFAGEPIRECKCAAPYLLTHLHMPECPLATMGA